MNRRRPNGLAAERNNAAVSSDSELSVYDSVDIDDNGILRPRRVPKRRPPPAVLRERRRQAQEEQQKRSLPNEEDDADNESHRGSRMPTGNRQQRLMASKMDAKTRSSFPSIAPGPQKSSSSVPDGRVSNFSSSRPRENIVSNRPILPPLDYSFLFLNTVEDILKAEPRAGRVHKMRQSNDGTIKRMPSMKQSSVTVFSRRSKSFIMTPRSMEEMSRKQGRSSSSNSNYSQSKADIELIEDAEGEEEDEPHTKYDAFIVRLCNNNFVSVDGIPIVLRHILFNPATLGSLDLSFNKLTKIEDSLAQLVNLHTLLLHANDIADARQIRQLAKMTSIKSISLHSNPFIENSKTAKAHYKSLILAHCSWLRDLDFTGVTPEELERAKVFAQSHKIAMVGLVGNLPMQQQQLLSATAASNNNNNKLPSISGASSSASSGSVSPSQLSSPQQLQQLQPSASAAAGSPGWGLAALQARQASLEQKSIKASMESVHLLRQEFMHLITGSSFSDIHSHAISSSSSSSSSIVDAFMSFRGAFLELISKYSGKENVGAQAVERARLYLDKWYVGKNPQPAALRCRFETASDSSRYTAVHTAEHSLLRVLANERQFSDILFVDNTGNVFYSVHKDADYATSLVDALGRGTASGLGKCFVECRANSAHDPTYQHFEDFTLYEPAGKNYSAFLAQAICEPAPESSSSSSSAAASSSSSLLPALPSGGSASSSAPSSKNPSRKNSAASRKQSSSVPSSYQPAGRKFLGMIAIRLVPGFRNEFLMSHSINGMSSPTPSHKNSVTSPMGSPTRLSFVSSPTPAPPAVVVTAPPAPPSSTPAPTAAKGAVALPSVTMKPNQSSKPK